MPEDANTTPNEIDQQTTPPAETPLQPPADPIAFINADGTFKEGWQNQFVPEEYRQLGEFSKVKAVGDLSRQLGYSVKLQGKKGVIVPGPGSDETVVAEFRKALNIPETGEGYKYEPVADVNLADMSVEEMKPIFEQMNKANYTQEQVNVGIGIFTDFIKGLEAKVDQENEQAVKDAEAQIEKMTGTNYDKTVHLANVAIDNITADWNDDYRKVLFDPESGLINDPAHAELKPYLLHLLAHTGEKMVEHKLISADGPAGGMTVDEISAKIAELEAMPGFMRPDENGKLMQLDGRKDQYNSLAKERDRLYRLRDSLQNKQKAV